MNRIRLEKFEMKYGYYLPIEYKEFLYKYGGDSQFGSCRFEYANNIVNNTLRIPGEMDFHIIPFGDIGNGDYYCFYRYGIKESDYYIGIWLHETRNFVILASTFRSFIYKCVLDEYLSLAVNDDSDDECGIDYNEIYERSQALAYEYDFDLEKIKKMKDEKDYHKYMAQYDEGSLQSLCYIGKSLLKLKDKEGYKILERIMEIYPNYTAPYYIAGRSLSGRSKKAVELFKKGLRTSLVTTGFSYWEEDYLNIPEDVHRELALFSQMHLKNEDGFLESQLMHGEDPYNTELRIIAAKDYVKNNNYSQAVNEYSNALYCCDDNSQRIEVLQMALDDIKDAGIYYLTGIIQNDLRKLK